MGKELELLKKIKQWVIENHHHHDGGEHYEFVISDNPPDVEVVEAIGKCFDVNSPYVNSMKLIKLLEELEKQL